MKGFDNRFKISVVAILTIILATGFWIFRGEAQPQPPYTQQTTPINISSVDANGNQNTGCAAASFGAAASSLNTGRTRAQIIAHFANVTDFDSGLAALRSFLNAINGKCYEITLKRLNRWDGPFVGTIPPPTTTTAGNTKTLEYKPFNFSKVDIAQAITAAGTQGGVIAGGVAYQNTLDPQNNWTWDAAHMVQITAINTNPNNANPGANPPQQPHDLRYNLQTYDPYYGTTRNTEYTTDPNGRSYALFWGAQPTYNQGGWFHLEELLHVKEVPCPTPPPDPKPAPPTGGQGKCALAGATSCTVPANCGPDPSKYSCVNYCCQPLTGKDVIEQL